MKRSKWTNRSTFILAAVGSAVGLGNAWRFPGLAAKYGGGAFLLVYLIAMLIIGIPMLMMEISIGRRMRSGAPGGMRGVNRKFEFVGWAAVSNAFVITTYYAVVFAWVLAMIAACLQFVNMTGDNEAAKGVFFNLTQTTGTISESFSQGAKIPLAILAALAVAWICIYLCIRNGAHSVGKVVKYTVFLPVICLVIMAAKGLTMDGAMAGIGKFFIPDFSALSDAGLWIDAFGQVFFSLSILMAIMFAYGSYLDEDSNIASDAMIIAFSDMAVSVLAGVVMFSTMGGVGMLDNISDSGIATAFVIYPQAIVNLTGSGAFNAFFGVIFYLCLATLAIDSAFSIVEGVSTAVSDKFKLSHKKTTVWVVLIAAAISVVYCTRDGLAWLDIIDKFTNQFGMVIVGVLECVAVGWFFKTTKALNEINRNTNTFKMPKWWFVTSIKFISPAVLLSFFIWNVVDLFRKGGIYGASDGYTLTSNIIGGWLLLALTFLSGLVVKRIVKHMNRKGFQEEDYTWDNPPRITQ